MLTWNERQEWFRFDKFTEKKQKKKNGLSPLVLNQPLCRSQSTTVQNILL